MSSYLAPPLCSSPSLPAILSATAAVGSKRAETSIFQSSFPFTKFDTCRCSRDKTRFKLNPSRRIPRTRYWLTLKEHTCESGPRIPVNRSRIVSQYGGRECSSAF
eukprot:2951858-Rhodomonas_salina.1